MTAINLSRRVPMLAIVVAAAVAVMLGAAASARADASVSVSVDGHLRGLATFYDNGDYFVICDKRKDNLPVAVRYSYIRKNGTIQRGAHWHTTGVDGRGNPNHQGTQIYGCSYGLHDFAENRRVWFQACVRHEGGALTCSKTQVTRA
jgi:hypothetical protein